MLKVASLVRAAGVVGHDRVRIQSCNDQHLIALCDGAGGLAGAADAAEFVAEFLVTPSRPPPAGSTKAFFVESLQWIDSSPLLPASGGLTTALIALVFEGAVQGASVGDSEAWLVSDTDVVVLTADQSRRPLVGSRRCRPVAFGPTVMKGTLVVGSDGLFKYCKREDLLGIARTDEFAAIPDLLLRATVLPSGGLQDDFAVVVCREIA